MGRKKRSLVERLAAPKRPEIVPTAIYTAREAAELLRIGQNTLTAEVHAGRLAKASYGRRYRFMGSDLLAWFEAQRQTAAV